MCHLMILTVAVSILAPVDSTQGNSHSQYLSGGLKNLQYFNNKLYIGATDQIYVLNSDLTINSSATTCNSSAPCGNVNKVLLVNKYTDELFTCGTGSKGACDLRGLDDIETILSSSSTNQGHPDFLKVSTVENRPVQALVTENENLMIAITYGNDLYKDPVSVVEPFTYNYAISTRYLKKYPLKSFEVFSRVGIKSLKIAIDSSHEIDENVIYYKGHFQHGGFSYFITNQKNVVGGERFVSKLVRICQNDTDYGAYTDIVLQCKGKDGKIYNLIQHAVLIELENTVLVAAIFTEGSDPEKSSGDSVICVDNLESLDDEIMEAKKNFALSCIEEVKEERYLEESKGKQCVIKDKYIPSDYTCQSLSTYKNVIGNVTMEISAGYQIHSDRGVITSLYGTVQNEDKPVLMMGTSEGELIMMNLDSQTHKLTTFNKTIVDDGVTITAIHAADDFLYVMSLEKIVRYNSTDCTEFPTCKATMEVQNPLCGWCVFKDRATRKDQTLCPTEQWLYSFDKCIELRLNFDGAPASNPQQRYLDITADYLPSVSTDGQYRCKFTVRNSEGLIASQTATKERNVFKCLVPNVTDHTTATLELMYNSISLASTDFIFYNCDHFQKCGECVNTKGANCSWSLNETKCKKSGGVSGESASEDSGETGGDIKTISECPRLTDTRGINFIPRNEHGEVELQGIMIAKALSAVPALKIWCYVPTEEGAVDEYVQATVDGGKIKCSIKIDSAEEAKKDVRVHIKYGKTAESRKYLDDDFNNTVTVYECAKLASDCSHCKALNKARYECGWCTSKKCVYGNCDGSCPPPNITQIIPTDGPIQGNTSVTIGGRELGINISEIKIVKIGEKSCQLSDDISDYNVPENDDFALKVPTRIVCRTKPVEDIAGKPQNVTVEVNDSESTGNVTFTYKEVTVTRVDPSYGPKSGGTLITLSGENLGVGNRIWNVVLGSQICRSPKVDPYAAPNLLINNSKHFTIVCETGSYTDVKNISTLILTMDSKVVYQNLKLLPKFRVLPNPNISDITGSKSGFLSGGTILTVVGKGMNNANKAVVRSTYSGEVVQEDCVIKSPEITECVVPKASKKLTEDLMRKVNNTDRNRKKRETCPGCIDISIVVKLDGVEKSFVLRYFRDPSIYKFGNDGDVLIYGTDERQLILSGESLNLVATKNDFNVTIGVENCTVIELTEDTLRCSPPNGQPAPVDPQNQFPEVKVNVGNIHVHVGYLKYDKKTELIAIIAGAAAGGLFFILVIIFIIGFIKYRKVGKKAKAYEKNLSDMEMEIKTVARQEFLDMHTTMSTVNKNLVEQGFPYHSYQQFACNVMFSVDYLWTEPVVSNGKMTDDERLKANKGMESLESLIYNKFFLVSVISTMENEKRFFIREKSNLAGNLCAVLMGKMDYLNEILKLLMTNLVQESSAKKHKTLFRRCESITEKLLSNWVSLCLYPHVKSHSGSPLYLLYMATQKTMESGPIDAVTADAKYTLSEEKLLKKWSSSLEEDGDQDLKFEAKTLTLNVVVDNGDEIFKCKALDCDTISQVKSKCLNQIYVNYPASQLPVGANDLALEWHEGFGGALKLQDEDNTSKHDGHWVRLNTLAHYNVKDESNMALIDPHNTEVNNQEDYVNLANINMDGVCDGSIDSSQPLTPHDEENPHEFEHWHLVKKEEESSKQGKSAIAELYLNRLFTTKQSLMEYMRPLFDIILDHDRCPPPTKFLYDFLDELGEKNKVEAETIHAWKSHSYAIRVWASLMKMPNTLFDVMIPPYMEENLNIISQVFIESFSIASQKFTKDSPSQKLIFHHEMNHYRERVKEFYKNVKVDSQNTEELRQYMADVNKLQQQTNFNKVSALYRFYNQLKPYFEDILENLSKSKEASTLQLDRKLEQVIAIMEEED